jgi:deoxyribonuclease V
VVLVVKMLPILKPKRLDLEELVEIQRRVAKAVVTRDEAGEINTVAGCDVSFARGGKACAACVVLDFDSLAPLEEHVVKVKLKFPYIPTFLAFRELEPLLLAAGGVKADVYMIGAHGLAHPRRAGLACHFGVSIDKPTLGVAKSRLCGEVVLPEGKGYSLVKDGKETIGAAVRARNNAKPLYVSVGHKLSLDKAIDITIKTTRNRSLPEPLIAAHDLATKIMRKGHPSFSDGRK